MAGCHAALTVVAMLLRVAWRSVADIVTRVVADGRDTIDRLAGLRRIGIDEISYRKGQRYLLCVVDHDTGRLVWAAKGRNQETLRRFFDALGDQRGALLTHVSADGAEWIHAVVAERAPQAVLCLDRVPCRGLGHRRPSTRCAARTMTARPGTTTTGHAQVGGAAKTRRT